MNFEKIEEVLDDALKNHDIPCSDIIVTLNGQTVYRYMNGTSDDSKMTPIKGDELYFLYSATKPITCTAALQLYEKGLIDLEDEVGNYIPEYKNMMVKTDAGITPAKSSMKIKHLFTMTSGMNYELDNPSIRKQRESNPESTTMELVRAMALEPLEFEPGTHFRYSLSHDVLAAIIEVVSGMTYGEYLKKNVFDICDMKHTFVSYSGEIKDCICSQYLYDASNAKTELIEKENMYVFTPKYQSGGAGLVSCVDDYILFANELVNGEKLLKRSTVDLMRKSHISGSVYEEFQSCKKGYSYGLGVRTNIDDKFSAKGEFGWDGAAGSYVLMDPDNHIAVFYATHLMNRGEYLYDKLHPTIRDIVYRQMGLRDTP